jgi:phosphopantothenate synthetase
MTKNIKSMTLAAAAALTLALGGVVVVNGNSAEAATGFRVYKTTCTVTSTSVINSAGQVTQPIKTTLTNCRSVILPRG